MQGIQKEKYEETRRSVIRLAIKIPEGRDPRKHADCVYGNFLDYFTSRGDFDRAVNIILAGGRASKKPT